MEMYVIDDKEENLFAAHTAIREAGHTLLSAPVFRECGGQIPRLSKGLEWSDKRATKKAWREIVWAIHLLKVKGGGIITDLMFSTTGIYLEQGLPPTGLMVATLAIAQGVPVCICTNASDEGGHHHGPRLSWIYDGFVVPFTDYQHMLEGQQDARDCAQFSLPFGWVEDKDWSRAIRYLEEARK